MQIRCCKVWITVCGQCGRHSVGTLSEPWEEKLVRGNSHQPHCAPCRLLTHCHTVHTTPINHTAATLTTPLHWQLPFPSTKLLLLSPHLCNTLSLNPTYFGKGSSLPEVDWPQTESQREVSAVHVSTQTGVMESGQMTSLPLKIAL